MMTVQEIQQEMLMLKLRGYTYMENTDAYTDKPHTFSTPHILVYRVADGYTITTIDVMRINTPHFMHVIDCEGRHRMISKKNILSVNMVKYYIT